MDRILAPVYMHPSLTADDQRPGPEFNFAPLTTCCPLDAFFSALLLVAGSHLNIRRSLVVGNQMMRNSLPLTLVVLATYWSGSASGQQTEQSK